MGSSLTDICYPNIEKESATTIDRLELPQRTACRNKRNSLKHDIGKECQLASDPAKKNKKNDVRRNWRFSSWENVNIINCSFVWIPRVRSSSSAEKTRRCISRLISFLKGWWRRRSMTKYGEKKKKKIQWRPSDSMWLPALSTNNSPIRGRVCKCCLYTLR